jgi:putative transposase
MARANRHFIPGHIWHLTHRCHKREFLLKFSKDRYRWIELLLEAKHRYRVSILNFIVTCNHVHLVLFDASGSESIPRAMQFIAGRVGQEYNRRKNRQGAFWQDRYHATAIESGEHLWRCIVYVDLNMVRAGVVDHPAEWRWSGYHEIQKPKIRYRLIDHVKLLQFLNADNHDALAKTHRRWVESQLKKGPEHQGHFSASIAVGSQSFIQKVLQSLGAKGIGRRMAEAPMGEYQLKESLAKYGSSALDPVVSHQSASSVINTIPWRWEKSLKP